MDRLISEKKVLDVINGAIRLGRFYSGKEQTIAEIKAIPSAEPNTGYWIEDEYEMEVRCSACGEENDECSNYCSNCGAIMIKPQKRSE